MKLKSFFIYAGLFTGVFLFTMTGYISGVSRSKEKEAAPIVAAKKEEIPEVFSLSSDAAAKNLIENFKETYILRENANKLSLFIRYANGDEQIHSEYDIAVNLLPKSDRERLKEGIEAESIDEALRLIEDYLE